MGKIVQTRSNAITAQGGMDENPQLLHIKKIQWEKSLKKEDVITFFMIITSIVIIWVWDIIITSMIITFLLIPLVTFILRQKQ